VTKLFVKICGITRPQDAQLATDLGATALGFVFWQDSLRYIAPPEAKAIAEQIPPDVMKVGVFVDESVEHVAGIVNEVGLDAAQLHGHETPEYCRALALVLSSFPPSTGGRRTIIKAIGMSDNGTPDISDFDPDVVLLVDAHDPSRYGGTGRTVNWEVAREIAAARPTILAGGLNAGNITLAVRSVRPFGIDVSSGVESAPGMKDSARMRSFFEALHD
jgi:phosphoribosylanthranilate isomerase